MKSGQKFKSNPGQLLLVNPRRRRRHHHRARSRSRYHRNPISMSGITGQVKDASVGAVGALINNYLSTQLASLTGLGSTYTTGLTGYLFRAATALGFGLIADKVGAGRATVMKMTEGALTVTIANMGIYMANTYASINLSGVGRAGRIGRGMGYLAPGHNMMPQLPGTSNLGRNVIAMNGNRKGVRGVGMYTRASAASLDGVSGTGEYVYR